VLAERRRPPEAVLEHLRDGSDVIVGVANGEPVHVLDAIEANADRFQTLRLHQMFPLRRRRYIDGGFPGLRHVSWFLSPASRDAFHKGACDLVPNSFSEVPHLMRSLAPALVVAAVSPPDRHGYFSLGCHAEYAAAFIGELPFFVEVNPRMPRTFGENQLR
jgi:acyl-CoA hydrolase